MVDYQTLIYEENNHIAKITFNRPDKLNALNTEVLTELNKVIEKVEKNTHIYALILTGSGKAFVAGADIAEMNNMSELESRDYSSLGNGVFNKIANLRPVTIAAVNGFALGGGLELALTTDIRIGTEKSVFGLPEVGLGIIPGFGGTQRLPRLIGEAKAKELLYTTDNIKGKKAYQYGLINRLVEEENLLEETDKLANQIASKAPLALERGKQAVNNGLNMPLAQALDYESEIISGLFNTEDKEEGMNSFINKFEPQYKRK